MNRLVFAIARKAVPLIRTATAAIQNVPQIAPPDATVVLALRRLTPTYSGPALRVRRDSDNAEADIGFTGAAGLLDTAALLAFVGSGSGYVPVWYGQDGGGRNATQPTAASQPRIVNAGVIETAGGKPALRATGSQWMALPNGALGTAPSYLINAVVCASSGGVKGVIGSGSYGTNYAVNALRQASGTGWANYWWGTGADLNVSTGFSLNTAYVVSATWGGAGTARVIYSNGTAAGSDTPAVTPNNPGTNVTLFRTNASEYWDGWIAEVVVSPAQTISVRVALERNQGAYFGVTVA